MRLRRTRPSVLTSLTWRGVCAFTLGAVTLLYSCDEPTISRDHQDMSLERHEDNHQDMSREAQRALNSETRQAPDLSPPSFTPDTESDALILDQEISDDSSPPVSSEPCVTLETLERVLLSPTSVSEVTHDQIMLARCQRPQWGVGLSRDTRWRLELTLELDSTRAGSPPLDELSALRLTLERPHEEGAPQSIESVAVTLTQETRGALKLTATLEWTARARGEHRVTLGLDTSTALTLESDYAAADVELSCIEGCTTRATRYPIVLIHGYAGVDEYFGFLDYFYRVPSALRARGYEVIIPSLSPIEWSEARALELSAALDVAQAHTGARRFNLIAHSQGGLDARILIADAGLAEHERVATLTTIATPHLGIPIRLTEFLSRQDFSPEYMNEFNQRYLDRDEVRYFSWSARTCTLLELSCLRAHDNELVTPFLLPTYTLLRRFGPSDGLVPTAHMVYGEHLGELSADHFDQIGQIADLDRGAFAHRVFYLEEAARLRSLGF